MNLSKLSVRRPVATTMVILIVMAFGVLSLNNIKLDLMPNMNIPVAIVSTSYSGTGPEEMEKLVTQPLEGVLGTVPGIDTITSMSSYGSSIVIIQFEDKVDIDMAALDMRERVDMIKSFLPSGADAPIVLKIDMNSMVSLELGFSSEKYDLVELTRIVEDKIVDRLQRQPGVAQVSVSGGMRKEIAVTLNEDRLRGYGISESQITQLLAAENRSTPTGSIKQGDKKLQLRVSGEFGSLEDIRNLIVTTPAGARVYLGDIAEIDEMYKELTTASYINGEPSVSVSVQKQSTANTVNVSDAVIRELDRISAEIPNLHARVILDPGEFIRKTLATVVDLALYGGVLAVLILYIFLRNYRSTLIVAVAMPISIVATFVLMYYANISFNMMSLGGIALGIGLLVDNSIVVLESIYRKFEEGCDRITASVDGAKEVAMAVTASTFTTVAVFLPITFVGGLIGNVFNEMSLTIAFSLISSLAVSLTFVPMASAVIIRPEQVTNRRHKSKFFLPLDYIGGLLDKLEAGYKILLDIVLRRRKTTIAVTVLLLILTGLSISSLAPEFTPSMDQSGVDISVRMPRGTLLSETKLVTDRIASLIVDIPEGENISVRIGGGGLGMFGAGGGSSDNATINLSLVSKTERNRSSEQVAREISRMLSDIPGAEINAEAETSAMGGGMFGGSGDVTISISGSNLDTLREISQDMKEMIEKIPGTRDVTTSLDRTTPQATIKINRMKAAAYGVNASGVSGIINTAIAGTVATTYKVEGDEYDIRVKHDPTGMDYIMDLESILIPSASGVNVPLYEIADILVEEMPVTIRRENQSRYVTVTARLDGRTSGEVAADATAVLKHYAMPRNYTWELSGSAQRMNEAFGNLGLALIISLFLIYMIMAAQFEAFLFPLIVMFSVPLALTGGLFGLFVLDRPFSITGFLGLIMLAGVVINNAIVLIDYTNLLIRERGMGILESLKTAGPVRLRPILMTTLTTVIGLMPMMFTTGEGAEMMNGLATVVVFGLTLSTLVTLLFVPVVYMMLYSVRAWVSGLFKRNY